MNAEDDANEDHHEQARSKNRLVSAQNFLHKVSLFGVHIEGGSGGKILEVVVRMRMMGLGLRLEFGVGGVCIIFGLSHYRMWC